MAVPAWLSLHAVPAVMSWWGWDLEHERWGDEPSLSCRAEGTPDATPRTRDALSRAQ